MQKRMAERKEQRNKGTEHEQPNKKRMEQTEQRSEQTKDVNERKTNGTMERTKHNGWNEGLNKKRNPYLWPNSYCQQTIQLTNRRNWPSFVLAVHQIKFGGGGVVGSQNVED
jgi:hypothetical protein